MRTSRRELLAILGPALARGQGVATRNVRAQRQGQDSGRPFAANFVDIAAQAGLRHPTIYGPVDRKDYIVETVGCGCAFLDYDNDGWMDILVLSGSRVSGAPEGTSSRLYRNNRDGTFADVTEEAGLLGESWASAVTVGDYDNDGYEDLFITAFGQNTLYHNNGDGTFTDVTREAGLVDTDVRWGAGCSFVDYDRDGNLDLFVSNYCHFDFATAPRPGSESCNWKGVPVHCGPRGLPFSRHSLYRNNGDGTFRDVSEEAGITKARPGYGMTVAAADYDNDGWPDIYVACDSTPSLLFRNRHDGTFEETGLFNGVALNEDGQEQAGMGVGVGDFSLSGNLDIFKTHFADDTNILYLNDGTGRFKDRTLASGLAVEVSYVCWGAGIVDLDNDGLPDIVFVALEHETFPLFRNTGNGDFEEVTGPSGLSALSKQMAGYAPILADFDNDGRKDLFVSCGHVQSTKQYGGVQRVNQHNAVFRTLEDGTFRALVEEAGFASRPAARHRGAAVGDFDADGRLDLVVTALARPAEIWLNRSPGDHHWLELRLSTPGTEVRVETAGASQFDHVSPSVGYASSSAVPLHFGLGNEAIAEKVEIRWPDGQSRILTNIEANQTVTVEEP